MILFVCYVYKYNLGDIDDPEFGEKGWSYKLDHGIIGILSQVTVPG
jgi:hypothetical protein